MCCGVQHNSYHTVRQIRFILSNGHVYDTGNSQDYSRFIESESGLAKVLTDLREQINNSPELRDKIRHKYRIKNTLGYGLNSFLDFNHPLDIFAHLLIGAEGTLAFVSRVTYQTIPDPGQKGTGLLLFSTIADACRMIPELKNLQADAVELMDYASLQTARYLENPPYKVEDLRPGSTALLVEFQRADSKALMEVIHAVQADLNKFNADCPGGFQTEPVIRQKLWQIRKALYPTVGSLRKKGTSVITEDICFDVEQLPAVVADLQQLFAKWDCRDAVVFGHAKDGNLHFVSSVDLETPDGIGNYEGLMNDLVEMTAIQHQGSLKAEHGTGRNMSAFIETEWGRDLAAIMWAIKREADPENILNPGVLLNPDSRAHMEFLKPLPVINDLVDLCVECGFCESVCPSRELTLTPRQRITLSREMELMRKTSDPRIAELEKDWEYSFSDTCAVDGLCEAACPVNIHTGNLVKVYRRTTKSRLSSWIAGWTVRNFSLVQKVLRSILRILHLKARFIGHSFFEKITRFIAKLSWHKSPVWTRHIPNAPVAREFCPQINKGSGVLYFPSCISRVFSANNEREPLAKVIIDIHRLLGKNIKIPAAIDDLCCGTPYQSKGYDAAYRAMVEKTVDQLFVDSQGGTIPILVDTTPCSFLFITGGDSLHAETKKKWQALTFIDILPYFKTLLKDVDLSPLDKTVVVHPTCSSRKLGQQDILVELARKCASRVIVPDQVECCGFAGDRGLLVPELTHSAVAIEAATMNLGGLKDVHGVSSSRMCEVGLSTETGIDFTSIALLVRDFLHDRL